MGLSLCYEFRFRGDAATARHAMEQLHEFAQTLEFDEVYDLVELDAPDRSADEQDELSSEQARLLRVFGSQYGEKRMSDGRDVWVDIPPKHVIAFGVHPAEGSEVAQIGLASHPPVVEYDDNGTPVLIETGLTGYYSWTQCCKTQYAGLLQNGGEANFLKAHLGLVELFDHAATLGIDVEVKDDSDYWEDRNEDKLRAALEEWNRMIAAFAGQLKDQLGPHLEDGIQAPIFTAPDFEHMEAKGLDEWTPKDEDDEEQP